MNGKLLILAFIFLCTYVNSFGQDCDCNIFPVKDECKIQCGMRVIQRGNKDQLEKTLNVKPATAAKIVAVPKRNTKLSVEEFKAYLPPEHYQDLKSKFDNWMGDLIIQKNNSGDNVGRDKYVITNNIISDSVRNKVDVGREDFYLPKLRQGYYCSSIGNAVDSVGNFEMEVNFESIGAMGRVDYISNTQNTHQYEFNMFINPDYNGGFSMGKETMLFNPGDKIKFYVYGDPEHPMDIHIISANGHRYYQRAKSKKKPGCLIFELQNPVREK